MDTEPVVSCVTEPVRPCAMAPVDSAAVRMAAVVVLRNMGLSFGLLPVHSGQSGHPHVPFNEARARSFRDECGIGQVLPTQVARSRGKAPKGGSYARSRRRRG